MGKNMDWIYRPINEPDLENTLEAVEKALGFKLFVWQKTFIATGVFRQYGATTVATSRQQLREYMKEYESKNIERHHAGWPGREDKHRIWK